MVNEEGYVTLELKPRKSRRFLQLVAKHALMHKFKRAHEYRSKFLEKIDKLRNIEKISELKKEEKISPKAPKSSEYLESQIKRMLEIEHYLEQEMRFNRQILSRLSENDGSQLALLKKVLQKEKIDGTKIDLLDQKLKQIDQLKKSVGRLRKTVEEMILQEKTASAREKRAGRKLDVISSKFEDEEKLLRAEMTEIKAMRDKLERVSVNLAAKPKRVVKPKIVKTPVKKKPIPKPKKKPVKKPAKKIKKKVVKKRKKKK